MGKKGKKKPAQGDPKEAPGKEPEPGPSAAAAGAQGDQPGGAQGKKGKKKGDQQDPPEKGPQPGPSGDAPAPQGDQPGGQGKKGKKKKGGQQDAPPPGPPESQAGDQPRPQERREPPPQGQGRRGEGDWRGPPQQERAPQAAPPQPTPQQGPRGEGPRTQTAWGPGAPPLQQGFGPRGLPPGQPQPDMGAGRGQRGPGGRGGPPQHQQQAQPRMGGPPQQAAGRGPARGPPPQAAGYGPPQQQQQQQQQQQRAGAWAQPQQQPAMQGPPGYAPPQQQQQQQPPQRAPTWGQQQQQQQPAQIQGPPGYAPAQQQQQPPPHMQGPPGYAPGQQQQPPPQMQRPPVQGPPQAGGPPAQRGPGRGPQQQQAQPQQRGAGRPGQQGRPGSKGTSESSTSSLSSAVARMRVSDAGDANIVSKIRFQPGKQGRVIKVESNHLALNLGRLEVAYHYDVNIVPDVPKKYMRPVIECFRKKRFPNRWPAFDGRKNLYTTSPLTESLDQILDDEVTLMEEDGREKKFKVQIKFANRVDMTPLRNLLQSPVTPQEAIQVVDIVLRMAPVATCFPVGRSFFIRPTNGIIDLGEGMEMYHGFYQSAIRGWKPLLNVDVAHKAFPQNIMVIDALAQILSSRREQFRREDLRNLKPYQEETLLKFIKTLRVTYEIPGHPGSRKNYRVNGLGAPAANARFDNNGQQTTIVDYFKRAKNYHLKYPDLPTLWVGNPTRPDKILLPLELCLILEGQVLNRKMTEEQTRNMIKVAATDTKTRKDKIVQGIQRANYNQHPCVKEFGFSVGNEFQKLDARVLTPPELQYANRTARVAKGVWRNETFLTPVTINSWTICTVCRYAPRPDDLRRMIELFERTGREVGMTFKARVTEPFGSVGGRQTYRDVEQYFKSQKGKFDVIFVVVPDSSGPEYSYVKKAAEIAVGCLTQCVKSVTVSRKMNPQTALNILLKVNSKLNGINHTFSSATKPVILKRPIMIMGADVTHPGPDSRDIPSVAAVTASHDPKAFQYNICWRLQDPTVEIIEDLESIVEEHLRFFETKTHIKPEAIVFFRDGVSEGQFEQVKNAEIRAIRSACKRVAKEGFEPKITFLVVQKRHHTRLFPTNPRDSEDRNCNVPAGTCVDTDITHPFMQDFYLVSHASIQGVAKPTKYCTLWDDNDMKNDDVEQLAYYLCHMFSRCNRSVSYPAPTYYAHLAAARAKVYIENDRLDMDRLRDEFRKYTIQEAIQKGLPMFFV